MLSLHHWIHICTYAIHGLKDSQYRHDLILTIGDIKSCMVVCRVSFCAEPALKDQPRVHDLILILDEDQFLSQQSIYLAVLQIYFEVVKHTWG